MGNIFIIFKTVADENVSLKVGLFFLFKPGTKNVSTDVSSWHRKKQKRIKIEKAVSCSKKFCFSATLSVPHIYLSDFADQERSGV